MALRGGEPGPLFKWKSGKYLTRAKFVTNLRTALSAAGYDERKFAGHSFRVGAATNTKAVWHTCNCIVQSLEI